MTDVGSETGRGNDCTSNDNGNGSKVVSGVGDDFSRSIARIAVAQICESIGFQRFQKSALDALSDIAIRYLRDIGKMACSHANYAGRTSCNVFDIVQGLEDLGSSRGFPGASDVNRCLAGSGIVREIESYVQYAEEIPFARPVPRFPVIRTQKLALSFAQIGEAPAGKHIPDWLPPFPNSHSCRSTLDWNPRSLGHRTDKTGKIEQGRKERNGERSLSSLQQQFACDDMARPAMMDAAAGVAANAGHVSECNVLPVAIPAKLSNGMVVGNGVSVVEIFVPVIEAAKNGFCNSDNDERRVLPKKRSTVHFMFGTGKKALNAPLNLSSRSTYVEKTTSWFSRDDEKDDNQRRVEQLCKEAVENPKEISIVK
ncbi:transcription initiation factor TFIID subunit 8-like [Magnolia sinica]|uniref:transcription initiation factor TFIID subunit 8-like n=1 Tax=Magnolia sinica TaxID=86752 RepID=UPI00265B2869|nr:transcription initiation factor TFIID subunit 8-like [Magnolia sinica]